MSTYRALKRLIGETSLERKLRYLFGAFILVLICGSFWLYAHQTEGLAYEQIVRFLFRFGSEGSRLATSKLILLDSTIGPSQQSNRL